MTPLDSKKYKVEDYDNSYVDIKKVLNVVSSQLYAAWLTAERSVAAVPAYGHLAAPLSYLWTMVEKTLNSIDSPGEIEKVFEPQVLDDTPARKPRGVLNQVIREQMREFYAQGFAIQAIAVRLGLHEGTVRKCLVQDGVHVSTVRKTEDMRVEWCEMWKRGESVRTIAKTFHCSMGTVAKHLAAEGLREIPKKSGVNENNRGHQAAEMQNRVLRAVK